MRDNGHRLIYMPDKDKRLAPPDQVSAYISARTGIPVTIGTIRPR